MVKALRSLFARLAGRQYVRRDEVLSLLGAVDRARLDLVDLYDRVDTLIRRFEQRDRVAARHAARRAADASEAAGASGAPMDDSQPARLRRRAVKSILRARAAGATIPLFAGEPGPAEAFDDPAPAARSSKASETHTGDDE
ncbi:MAG: hypothetical protein GWO02_08470 [Gammaproteobacteria bacterium]|nr:hypothetical protein [Gammaproteobacteria bacterium]